VQEAARILRFVEATYTCSFLNVFAINGLHAGWAKPSIGTPRRLLRLFSERTEMAELLRLLNRVSSGFAALMALYTGRNTMNVHYQHFVFS